MSGRDRVGVYVRARSERWIRFGSVEGGLGATMQWAARLLEAIQLPGVVLLESVDYLMQFLKESGRFLIR